MVKFTSGSGIEDTHHFIVDSQDLDHLCESLGIMRYRDDITGAMARVEGNEYEDVYLTESRRPYDIYANWHTLEFYTEE